MKTLLAFATVLTITLPTVAHAQIYQWKDENGKTILSDKPPVGHTPIQRRAESSPQNTTNAAGQKNMADKELEFRKRQKESQESAEKSRKEQQTASEKQQYCESARRQLKALQSGERIATRDDKGERSYLDDKQREQETEKLRQSMQQNNCGE